MSGDEVLQKLLKSFERYYNVNSETPVPPFAAQAEFHSNQEQYFLVKAAHLSDSFSNEYVYFSVIPELTSELLSSLSDKAWQDGLAKVKPVEGHKNTDVSLFIIADKIADDTKKIIKKTKFHKSYMFTFRGWSDFRLVAMETSSKELFSNRLGRDFKKIFKTIN